MTNRPDPSRPRREITVEPLRVGYILKMYPRLSETFIVTEILAHEAAGVHVEIFSLRPPIDGRFHESLARVMAPVNYLPAERVKAEEFWAALGRALPRPAAIVSISAHWVTRGGTGVTRDARPRVIYDMHGFPDELYRVRYDAPGHPELAAELAERLAGSSVVTSDAWGFDHGTWSVLSRMYPEADIPCIQVSLAASLDAAEHVRIGKALAALKTENLLFLGSGFSFHNMKALINKRDDSIDPRNQEFENWLAATCSDPELSDSDREQRLIDWESAPHARYCHPREEHLLPLQVCYGVGQGAAKRVFQEPVAGFIASAYQWD